VAAVSALRKHRPKLNAKLGLVLTFFCAGPPCAEGTLALLNQLKVNPEAVNEIRYRGNGWPGNFKVTYNNRSEQKSLTYQESWGSLVKHPRSFRCHLCPDGLGELADISCGDAWHLYGDNGDAGRSLVLVRTDQGQDLLGRAMAAGYFELVRSQSSEVIRAQPLAQRRAVVFGRLMAMKALLIPVPKFIDFSLHKAWMANPLSIRIRTILGTSKRLLTRGLWHRKQLFKSNKTTRSQNNS
jgi:coenzyme F420 hydrogenase subunit beta